jgi:beta-lactamase superfamily II metal-dependent hydrolase
LKVLKKDKWGEGAWGREIIVISVLIFKIFVSCFLILNKINFWDMSLQIKFFSVGCGDAIAIRFLGDDGKFHNIFIDGGIENKTIYTDGIKKEILSIVDRGEIIDLWIISHIDDDHIGGVLCFVKDIANDSNFRNQVDLSKTQFWFNYADKDYDTGIRNSDFRGVEQGMRLRDFLSANSKLESNSITNTNQKVDFLGLALNIFTQVLKNKEIAMANR